MNYHPEKALMACLATFLFLIALMGAYLKYAEAVEAGTEGAPALLYMLVMFFVIFIVAGSVTALLVGILTPMATRESCACCLYITELHCQKVKQQPP